MIFQMALRRAVSAIYSYLAYTSFASSSVVLTLCVAISLLCKVIKNLNLPTVV